MTNKEIQKMSPNKLKERIGKLNEQLKSFGWKDGIGSILYGCKTHGRLYENKELKNGVIKPTPMNCLAIISHYSPDLIIELIHKNEFEEFLKIISQLGMCLETATIKLNLKGDSKEIKIFPEEWQ